MTDLKPGWTRVRFGDVVRLVRETCKDPSAAGIERVIGLEHLEPGALRVRSWGTVAEGTTFTSRVRPGQVLFGKRRAYQRKAAVADFDAVCSGDIYIFESANPKRLLPTLLPFICQTGTFFDHAIGTSAGSLSPRTNWSSLAEYEFALPPVEEQRRICELLRAASRAEEAFRRLREAQQQLREAALRDQFSSLAEEADLQSVCRPIVRGIDSPGPEIAEGTPYVRITEMTGPEGIVRTKLKRTRDDIARAHPESQLMAGDIVVALRGVVGLAVRVPLEAAGVNLSRGTARVSVVPPHSAEFFYYALQSHRVRREVLRVCTGWKGEDLREITLGSLRELRVPVPAPEVQVRLAGVFRAIDQAEQVVSSREASVRTFIAECLRDLALESAHVQ